MLPRPLLRHNLNRPDRSTVAFSDTHRYPQCGAGGISEGGIGKRTCARLWGFGPSREIKYFSVMFCKYFRPSHEKIYFRVILRPHKATHSIYNHLGEKFFRYGIDGLVVVAVCCVEDG